MSKFTSTDKLFFKYLVAKRGHICEIHQRECPGIGPMHLLSKATAPRLRYDEWNVILACWFGAHYPTHHDPDGDKAVYAKKRICELRGYSTWQELRDELKLRARIAKKVDLGMTRLWLKQEITSLQGKDEKSVKTFP